MWKTLGALTLILAALAAGQWLDNHPSQQEVTHGHN